MIQPVTRYVVECDGDALVSLALHVPGSDQTIIFHGESDAAETAVNLGWRTDGERYWCPSCQVKPHDCQPDPEDRLACARCGDPVDGGES